MMDQPPWEVPESKPNPMKYFVAGVVITILVIIVGVAIYSTMRDETADDEPKIFQNITNALKVRSSELQLDSQSVGWELDSLAYVDDGRLPRWAVG